MFLFHRTAHAIFVGGRELELMGVLVDGFGERFVPRRVKAGLPNDHSVMNQLDIS